MKTFTDQLGYEIQLDRHPSRIISLVPSQTELLYDLGLEDEVVGITKFCVHPSDWRSTKTIIGGTKKLRFKEIDDLSPDLIIANKEENTREDIERLKLKYRVWISDVNTLDDAFHMINMVGKMTNRVGQAQIILDDIVLQKSEYTSGHRGSAVYFIWKEPWMVAAGGTFIDEMMNEAGFTNIFGGEKRYPAKEIRDLVDMGPDHLLLSTEPFPFKPKDIAALRH